MKKRAFLFLEFTRRCFEQPSVVRDHCLALPLAASARTAVAPDSCGGCPVASLSWPSGSCPSVLLVAPAAYGYCNCLQEDLSAKSCSSQWQWCPIGVGAAAPGFSCSSELQIDPTWGLRWWEGGVSNSQTAVRVQQRGNLYSLVLSSH